MISRFLIVVLFVLAALGTSGCFSFGRKSKEPKPAKEPKISNTPVADMEKDFRKRWVAQRAAELTAKGVEASEAQNRAAADFAEAFRYTKPGK